MNGFEKRREQKKNQILDALSDLILTRNFKDIGIRELAEHANVSPASIYNFFGSKDELARQAFYRYAEQLSSDLITKLRADIPFKDKVKLLVDISMRKQEELNSEGIKNYMFEDPAFEEFLQEYSEKMIVMVSEIIEQGKVEGEISHAISTETIMLFMTCISDMVKNPKIRDAFNDKQMRKELSQLFFYGVFGKE